MKKNTLFLSLILTYTLCALAFGEWNFYKDQAGEWRWNRTADNNEIIAASTEGYKNREDAANNAAMSGYLIPPDNNLIGDPVEESTPAPEATPSEDVSPNMVAEPSPTSTPCPPCPCASPSPQPF